MSNTATPRVISYIRFSTSGQSLGRSEQRQLEDAREWCVRKGYKLDESLKPDRGKSGYHGHHRKKGHFGRFLAMVQAGAIEPGTVLLVENIDRLGREAPATALRETIFRLWDHDITIQTFNPDETYGPGTDRDTGKFIVLYVRLEQAYARSKRASDLLKDVRKDEREQARKTKRIATTHAPLWLEVVGRTYNDRNRVADPGAFETIPERAAAVRRIFELAGQGEGYGQIARRLHKEGHEPFKGKNWCRSYVRFILTDRRALGEHQPIGTEPIAGYYPSVVSEEEFARAQEGRDGRTLRKGKSNVWTAEQDQLVRSLPAKEAHKILKQRGVKRTYTAVYQRKRRLVRDAMTTPTTKTHHETQYVNVFARLIKNARDQAGYALVNRLDSGEAVPVLVNSAGRDGKDGAVVSFPYATFEAAILSQLAEIDPSELSGQRADGEDEVTPLRNERDRQRAKVKKLEAIQAEEPSLANARVLRQAEEKVKQLDAELAAAVHRAAHPAEATWREFRNVYEVLRAAEDPVATRLKLRAILYAALDSICLLVIPRGRSRLAFVQVDFREGHRRMYRVFHRPPKGNKRGRVEGEWRASSWREDVETAQWQQLWKKLCEENEVAAELKRVRDSEGRKLFGTEMMDLREPAVWSGWEKFIQGLSAAHFEVYVTGCDKPHPLP